MEGGVGEDEGLLHKRGTVRLKSSDFSTISLETLETGVTLLTIEKVGGTEVTVSLLPEELGILLVSFGNSITKGRDEEVERLKEHQLKMEKRKLNV